MLRIQYLGSMHGAKKLLHNKSDDIREYQTCGQYISTHLLGKHENVFHASFSSLPLANPSITLAFELGRARLGA